MQWHAALLNCLPGPSHLSPLTIHPAHCCCYCRMLGKDSFMGTTKLCRPGSHAYDEALAAKLWETSAEYAGVPVQPKV